MINKNFTGSPQGLPQFPSTEDRVTRLYKASSRWHHGRSPEDHVSKESYHAHRVYKKKKPMSWIIKSVRLSYKNFNGAHNFIGVL